MGAEYVLKIRSFTVTKSNPSGTNVRFTISSDSGNLLTTSKMLRAVLVKAIGIFIDAEEGDLVTNGDGSLVTEFRKSGDDASKHIAQLFFEFEDKRATLELTSLSSIAPTGDITVDAPFADV